MVLDAIGGCLDVHALLARAHARRGIDPRADVDHAHAAHPDRVVAIVVAKAGDLDAELLGGVEDRGAVPDRDLATIDLQADVLREFGGSGFWLRCPRGPKLSLFFSNF